MSKLIKKAKRLLFFGGRRLATLCALLTIHCSLFTIVNAQTVNKLSILARVKTDTVALRWAPTTIPVWQLGNKYGYNIQRFTIVRNGEPVPDGLTRGELLTPTPIKPATEAVLERLSGEIPAAAVVQEAVYGKDFQMPDPAQGFSAFLKGYQELEARFGFALFVCDFSPKVAAAAGLYFVDTDVHAGERYAYKISLATVPQGFEIEPSVKVVDAGKPDEIPAPTELRALFGDHSVSLQWPIMLHRGVFTAYILEKSTDGTTF